MQTLMTESWQHVAQFHAKLLLDNLAVPSTLCETVPLLFATSSCTPSAQQGADVVVFAAFNAWGILFCVPHSSITVCIAGRAGVYDDSGLPLPTLMMEDSRHPESLCKL